MKRSKLCGENPDAALHPRIVRVLIGFRLALIFTLPLSFLPRIIIHLIVHFLVINNMATLKPVTGQIHIAKGMLLIPTLFTEKDSFIQAVDYFNSDNALHSSNAASPPHCSPHCNLLLSNLYLSRFARMN